MRSRTWRSVAVTALCAAAVVATTDAPGRAAPPPAAAGTIVGHVDDTGPATVEAYAWPVDGAGAADGTVVDTVPVGSATTGSDGTYRLDLDVAALPPAYTTDGINLEFRVSTPAWFQDWVGPLAGLSRLDFSPSSGAVRSRMGGRVSSGPAQAVRTTDSRHPADGPPCGTVCPKPCTSWSNGPYIYDRKEHFTYVYGRPKAKATVTEEVGSSHTLGVATNVNGGGWGVSGSMDLENHSGTGVAVTYAYANLLYNRVNYRHRYMTCDFPTGIVHFDRVTPVSFYDLLSDYARTGSPWWTACATRSTGDYWKTSGSNLTFAAGVDLPYFNLSAHAAFTHETSIHWHLVGYPVMICGSTDEGWAASPQMGVKQVPHSPPGCRPGGPCAARR